MSWEEGNVSKFSLAVAESTASKGSGRGSMWGRREETQWSLKGRLDIYWSEFLSTLGHPLFLSQYIQSLLACPQRWGAHSLFPLKCENVSHSVMSDSLQPYRL